MQMESEHFAADNVPVGFMSNDTNHQLISQQGLRAS